MRTLRLIWAPSILTLAVASFPTGCTSPSSPDALLRATTEAFSGTEVTASRFSDANGWGLDPSYYGTVAFADVNGDGRVDACGRGPTGIVCVLGGDGGFGAEVTVTADFTDRQGWAADPKYWSTIRWGDVDGDGKADVCGRFSDGFHCWTSSATGLLDTPSTTAIFSDTSGWDHPEYYSTISLADVTGDGRADACARSASYIVCYPSTGHGFDPSKAIVGPGTSDAGSWNRVQYYSTIHFADVNGDKIADVCMRSSVGVACALSTGNGFGGTKGFEEPALSDSNGGAAAAVYGAIRLPNVNGDGAADLCYRTSAGMKCDVGTPTALAGTFTSTAFADGDGYSDVARAASIRFGDLNGDGRADACGVLADGAHCFVSNGSTFSGAVPVLPRLADGSGGNDPKYGGTFALADVNGDGRADACVRTAGGVVCTLMSAPAAVAGAACKTCSDQHRRCDFGTASVAVCGPCEGGFVSSEKGVCVPAATCANLDCASRHQTCIESDTAGARCGDTCVPGFVWDPTASSCRAAKTCADLKCTGAQTCAVPPAGGDAYCAGNACPAGKGLYGFKTGPGGTPDPTQPICHSCTFAIACNDTGATGNLLATADQEGAACICEARDGYFFSEAEGSSVLSCDADGDGWVNEAAQPVAESTNPVVSANARCHVRRVSKFALETEGHARSDAAAEDLTSKFPGGLPLYESERNEGITGDAPAPYGALGGKVLNSLTKACVSAIADFNTNDVPDVAEGAPYALGPGFAGDHPASQMLSTYYQKYAEYSYFLELHNGWYEPPASGTGPGVYRIQERERTAAGPGGVALRDAADPGGYWNECPRSTDKAYVGATVGVGGDFADKRGAWGEMTHHSQFKCVAILAEQDYKQAKLTEAKQPQAAYVKSGALTRMPTADGPEKSYASWVTSTCAPQATGAVAAPGFNPAYPTLTCAQKAPSADLGVAWAVVTGWESDPSGQIVRGCNDLCAAPVNGGCDGNASCSRAAGFPACGCKRGFAGDGTTCVDLDECKLGLSNCTGGNVCQNTPGSFTCTACPSGYTSNDGVTCVDYNECQPGVSPCSSSQACTNTVGSYVCTACASGYQSDGVTCSDVNECAFSPSVCAAHAACTNTPGSYYCSCTAPYEGDGATGCSLPDYCANEHRDCGANAHCYNDYSSTPGSQCACNTGYVLANGVCVYNAPPCHGPCCKKPWLPVCQPGGGD